MDREGKGRPKEGKDLPKAIGLAGGRAKIQTQILHHDLNDIAKGNVQESFIFYSICFSNLFLN